MKRKAVFWLCGYLAFVLLLSPTQAAESRFHHKTLTRWLELHASAKPGSHDEVESRAAIEAIGTNALPQLVGMVSGSDGRSQQLAGEGFQVLGPAAASAVPALARLLGASNLVVMVFSANALGRIGVAALPALLNALTNGDYNAAALAALALVDLGADAGPAVPVLLCDLNSPNRLIRERAAVALGNLRLQPEIVVPALTGLLTHRSLSTRCLALGSLGRFQAAARPAVPAIVALLNDPEPDIRTIAASALSEIAPESAQRASPPRRL